MNAKFANEKILGIVITILALGDGLLHFVLDYVLFRGTFLGSPFPAGPRPGGATPPARPGGNPLRALPLNELFVLNLVGEIVLVVLFWTSRRWLGDRRWLIDVAMMVYAAITFGAWLSFGRPNPMGLGYLSKAIEIVLIVVLFVHARGVLRVRGSRVAPT